MNLQLEIQPRTDGPRVLLKGEVDVYTSPGLKRALTHLTAEHQRVEVDLTEVEYLDSCGLAVLLGCEKRAREHAGHVVLVNPSAGIRRVLEVTGMDRILTVEPGR